MAGMTGERNESMSAREEGAERAAERAPDDPLDHSDEIREPAPVPTRAALVADAGALVAWLRPRLLPLEPDATTTAEADHTQRGRPAAVLAPLFAVEGRPYLIFTQRSTQLSRHSGQMSFPGGGRDPGDATLLETALRETREELGLVAPAAAALGRLPSLYTIVSDYTITPFVAWLGEGRPTLAPNPAEVADVLLAPFAALADPASYHAERWSRGGEEHTVHFYDIGAFRIWGATGHLLHSLLALLPPPATPPNHTPVTH